MFFERPIPDFLEPYIGVPDVRVDGWPGLTTPSTVILLYVVYGMILTGGRRCMKLLPPFELRGVLVTYNVLQIIINAYILEEVISCMSTGNYSLACAYERVDQSTMRPGDCVLHIHDPATMRLARAVWLFYLSKMIDLMDTVFFVLRKKDKQITFLHVYHHVAMLSAWYLGALYTPGGQAWLSVVINAGIHVLMYTYYLISSLGPSYRKYLWWKKYLTQLQLTQFFVVGGHVSYLLHKGCARPRWLACIALCYNVTLIVLFFGFYRNAYRKEKTSDDDPVKKRTGSDSWIEKPLEDKKRS